jgi:molybdate transport system permease protein
LKHGFGSTLTDKIVILIVALIVLGYFLFVTIPLLAVFLRIEPSQLGAQLRSAGIIEAIKLSLYTSATATLIAFVLAVPSAYFMVTRNFPGKAILDTLMDLPIVLPPAVAGVALLYTFAPKGLLGPISNRLGFIIPGSTLAVIIAETFVASPFLFRSAKTGFESMDKDIINSARMLSGSRLRIFFTITFPLSLRAIISGTMMTWARAMGEFGATLMFAGNIAGITQTMPLAIYMFLYYDPLAGITLSAILIIISFSLLITVKILEQKRFGAKK